MAATNSKTSKKKSTKPVRKRKANKLDWKKLKTRFQKLNNRRTLLAVSLILNALLAVGLLFSISNPTSYTDASSGYTVEIPAGWDRQDQYEVFRMTLGSSDDPRAQIYAYGQRNATLGFYDAPEEDRNNTLDQVTEQINNGQNQFILTRFELSGYEFDAERGQEGDGTEFIRSHFTAVNADGEPVEGEHLLLITMGGGVYSVVGYADANYWPQISDEVDGVMSSFTAP